MDGNSQGFCIDMAYALEPVSGEDLWVDKWNWHPTLELLVRAGILSSERAEPLHYNCGGAVTETEANKICEFLNTYLQNKTPGERLLIDGSTAIEADTYELFRGSEWDKNYSATVEWLQSFRDFCNSCRGFKVL